MNIIVLDLGGTAIKYGYFQEDTLLFHHETPSEAKLGGVHLMQKIIKLIHSIRDNYPADAIGISSAGQIDSETGTVIYANENIPCYSKTPIKKLLMDEFHLPVFVENDVNSAAIGENCYGSGKEHPNFLCLTYGTGIGGGIVLNHKLLKGSTGVAAEFGHMITHPNGLPCGCGSRGCYEMYGSTSALIKKAKQKNAVWTNGKLLFESYHAGNTDAIQLINDWICEISYGLINLIYIFNPSCIILGGGIMEQDCLIKQLTILIRQHTQSSYHNVKLIKASLGNLAGLYGIKAVCCKDYVY